MQNLYMSNYSPSSINTFIDYRTRFYLERVLKLKSEANLKMEFGKNIEEAITNCLINKNLSIDEITQKAVDDWYLQTLLEEQSEEVTKMGDKIPALIETGYEALKKYGNLIGAQRRIEVDVPDVSLPFVGVVDFDFENDVIIDLKVTGSTPSKMSSAHARQGAFYKEHTPDNKKTIFVYLVPLKTKINVVEIELNNSKEHYNNLISAAKTIDYLLNIEDLKVLEKIFYPNLSDFNLSDPEFAKNVKEVWGVNIFE